MRIDTSGLYPSQRTSHNTAETTGSPHAQSVRESGSDSFSVSSRGRLLALAREALDAAPDVREHAVEAARVRVSGGEDGFDGQTIASAMINTISEETAG